jgi:hypothetical protein
MKRRPAPGIIGSPGPPIGIAPYPISIRGIRDEIRTGFGNPDIAILWLLNPMSIWTELIVKFLIGDIGVFFRYILLLRRNTRSKKKN